MSWSAGMLSSFFVAFCCLPINGAVIVFLSSGNEVGEQDNRKQNRLRVDTVAFWN